MQCGSHFEVAEESEKSVLCFACQMQCQKRLNNFWRRVLAFLLDNLILTFLTAILATLLGLNDQQFLEEILAKTATNTDAIPEIPSALLALYVLVPLFYFAGFESSPLQATPGKLLLRIYVTDLQGRPIGFWRAIGRYLGKIASSVILNLGYLLAALTVKKQALHDILARTLVIKHPPKMKNKQNSTVN